MRIREFVVRNLTAVSMATTAAFFSGAVMAEYDDGNEIPFSVSNIYFELNNTDGDLGIHALIDGEPWKSLQIEDPREREMLDIDLSGRLRRQGLTELFFESAEPTFDELAPEKFFKRFPEGEYEIEGITLEGLEMESTSLLSHVLPGPPVIYVSGVPTPEDCDDDPIPVVSNPVIVEWDPVTESHPELGKWGPIEVTLYQLVVEREEPVPLKFTVDLPPNVTSMELPAELIGADEEFKLEVLVREASGNQTATETCFLTE